MSQNKCRICNNESENEIVSLSERHFGYGDKFDYLVCARCKCIQIMDIPANIEKYYPEEYYSFETPKFNTRLNWFNFLLKKSLINYYMGYFDPTGFLLSFIYDHPFPWIRKRELNFNSKILDVGTGTGRKILSLQRSGFKDLTGTDPYISQDSTINNVSILKKDISEINDTFDCITLHHSFEHMPDPMNVIKHLKKLLDKNGVIIIRIPVANCYAWYKYGEFWVQLDAPRHFFIHTPESIGILLESTGLYIDEIVYDSGAHQFIMSEKYKRGLTLFAKDNSLTKKEIRNFENEAKNLNKNKQGDTACFYIKKKK